MVQMETETDGPLCSTAEKSSNVLCYEYTIHRAPVKVIDEWQRRHSTVCRMDSSVANDGPSPVLKHAARPANLLPGAQHRHAQRRLVRHAC